MNFREWVEEQERLDEGTAQDVAIKLIAKLLWPPEWARTVAVLPTITPSAAIIELADQIWKSANSLVKGQVAQAAEEAGLALPKALLSAAKTIWYANGNIQRIGQPVIKGWS
jgi:hypothetical protein